MEDQDWLTGDFEGHYAGLPMTAGGDIRVYKPNVIRAIIRSPRRTNPMMSAETVTHGEKDFDRRRKIGFHQDFISDAVVVTPSGTAVRVALEDVHVFDWYVPVSAEHEGRTFGRIQGRMIARVVKPIIAVPAAPSQVAGVKWWGEMGGLSARWGLGALALGIAAGTAALCANLGFPSGLACLCAALGLYLLLYRRSSPLLPDRGCLSSMLAPALILAAIALPCTQFRGLSSCQGSQPTAQDAATDALVVDGGTFVSADAVLANPSTFFASDDQRVYLSEATLFDFNSADLSTGAASELRKIARVLQEDRTRRVIVEGYADTIGETAANQAISEKRAEAVRRWLVDKAGVSPDQITAVGRGSDNPIAAPNGNKDEQRVNRRVEVRPKPLK